MLQFHSSVFRTPSETVGLRMIPVELYERYTTVYLYIYILRVCIYKKHSTVAQVPVVPSSSLGACTVSPSNLTVSVQNPVAGGAAGDAAATVLLFALDAQPIAVGTRGQNDGVRLDGRKHHLQPHCQH